MHYFGFKLTWWIEYTHLPQTPNKMIHTQKVKVTIKTERTRGR